MQVFEQHLKHSRVMLLLMPVIQLGGYLLGTVQTRRDSQQTAHMLDSPGMCCQQLQLLLLRHVLLVLLVLLQAWEQQEACKLAPAARCCCWA
jgi:hypothetical protein